MRTAPCIGCGRETPNTDEICSKCRTGSHAARLAKQRGERNRTKGTREAFEFAAWEEYCNQYDDENGNAEE